ncbi:MAG: hypothetical protein GEV05_14955 [Betaproteobacteria bacterium]|nr:hypothetical protein [Betaproteobacteria bacterium]
MGSVHPLVSPRSVARHTESIIAVVCAYACRPGEASETDRCWRWALELAHTGFQVWVVTSSEHRSALEHALASVPDENVHVLFWDAPAGWRFLRRWRVGTRLHARMWYRFVGRAIDDWQRALGMRLLRRVVDSRRASVTYLVLPSVQRGDRPGFLWQAQSD